VGKNSAQKMDYHQPGIVHQQQLPLQNPNLSHVTNPLNCAIIQNLPHDCNENQLHAFFEDEIGGIVDCRIPLDLKTGKLPQSGEKAFAVCEFTDRSLAESCARNCSGREFKERKLRVRLLESVEFGSDGWPVSASVSGGIGDFNAEGGGGQQLLRVTVVTESDKRRRELQQLDLNGYHPSVPVGLAVAKAASSLMAPAGAFSQPTDGKGAAMDLLSKRIGDLTPTQMFDVVRELKEMAEGDPVGTRNLLSANPQLCLAAFQCQLALGMVKVPMIEEPSVGVAAPPPPQMMQQQQQQQRTIPPPQVANVAPPQMAVNRGAPPPPPPPVQQQQQQQQQQPQQPDSQAQLLAQVMALTPQQIATLPPDQRMQVEQLRQIAAAQGMI
jgi:cleavage stimulation factor subunit 2